MKKEWNTRQSLIMRAKDPTDEEAWADFVGYYERFIFYLLHRMNIKSDDLDDLAQMILVKLWKYIGSYEKQANTKFRTWLGLVVRNIVYTYYQTEQRRKNVIVSNVEIDEETIAEEGSDLEKTIVKEWEIYMTNFALERMRGNFSETAVKVFEMSLSGTPAKEIAASLNISVDSVYTLKNRAKTHLIEEIRAIKQKVEL